MVVFGKLRVIMRNWEFKFRNMRNSGDLTKTDSESSRSHLLRSAADYVGSHLLFQSLMRKSFGVACLKLGSLLGRGVLTREKIRYLQSIFVIRRVNGATCLNPNGK